MTSIDLAGRGIEQLIDLLTNARTEMALREMWMGELDKHERTRVID